MLLISLSGLRFPISAAIEEKSRTSERGIGRRQAYLKPRTQELEGGPDGNAPRTPGTGFRTTALRFSPALSIDHAAGHLHTRTQEPPVRIQEPKDPRIREMGGTHGP